MTAAEDGTHAGQQLPPIERFGEIIVGAHLQAEDGFHFLAMMPP